MRSLGSVLGMALLSLAIFFGAVAVGHGIRDRNRNNDTLTVTGSAKQRITSDYVVWDASVGVRADTQEQAAKTLKTWTHVVTTFLTGQGVLESEITFQPPSVETVSSHGAITAYVLRRPFEVRSGRVATIANAVDASSKLLEQGIGLTSDPLQYVYTKLALLRPQLLAAATKDALTRAKTLVAVTGSHLGRLRGVDVGVFQITSPNSTQVEDYGVYDTSTLEKDVTAVVNVTFAVN